ncbi:hypothetical protein BU24DRAFT_447275 [Aaosphaeria arxii CBS 175.79]|uniref:Uncharacterized protein n=1 Tax=Aaosphaeria arxii CBS 175.79 TaxID=1450172 RepID=A0A6A5XZ66_9PLEO|nr:uncharacterized protein BU24DRAFT_447275 [Aaosphaeria arxii CBS 175.79]KAF2018615.1 hypothetical protein BU24DRAFT_447275 [Aaosphaeria arxii CBS 175.79]
MKGLFHFAHSLWPLAPHGTPSQRPTRVESFSTTRRLDAYIAFIASTAAKAIRTFTLQRNSHPPSTSTPTKDRLSPSTRSRQDVDQLRRVPYQSTDSTTAHPSRRARPSEVDESYQGEQVPGYFPPYTGNGFASHPSQPNWTGLNQSDLYEACERDAIRRMQERPTIAERQAIAEGKPLPPRPTTEKRQRSDGVITLKIELTETNEKQISDGEGGIMSFQEALELDSQVQALQLGSHEEAVQPNYDEEALELEEEAPADSLDNHHAYLVRHFRNGWDNSGLAASEVEPLGEADFSDVDEGDFFSEEEYEIEGIDDGIYMYGEDQEDGAQIDHTEGFENDTNILDEAEAKHDNGHEDAGAQQGNPAQQTMPIELNLPPVRSFHEYLGNRGLPQELKDQIYGHALKQPSGIRPKLCSHSRVNAIKFHDDDNECAFDNNFFALFYTSKMDRKASMAAFYDVNTFICSQDTAIYLSYLKHVGRLGFIKKMIFGVPLIRGVPRDANSSFSYGGHTTGEYQTTKIARTTLRDLTAVIKHFGDNPRNVNVDWSTAGFRSIQAHPLFVVGGLHLVNIFIVLLQLSSARTPIPPTFVPGAPQHRVSCNREVTVSVPYARLIAAKYDLEWFKDVTDALSLHVKFSERAQLNIDGSHVMFEWKRGNNADVGSSVDHFNAVSVASTVRQLNAISVGMDNLRIPRKVCYYRKDCQTGEICWYNLVY